MKATLGYHIIKHLTSELENKEWLLSSAGESGGALSDSAVVV